VRSLASTAALALFILGSVGCGGGSSRPSQPPGSASVAAPVAVSPPERRHRPAGAVARHLLGLPPVAAGSPLPGYLLIADRDNNRIIVVSPRKRVVWQFPPRGGLPPGQSFAGPDDAFMGPGGRTIITNEEFADTIAVVRLGRHPRIVYQYGHTEVPGSGPGYLSHPDDAYELPGGLISVADIVNCRVLFLNRRHRVVRSIGSAGDCAHDPPRSLSEPNGDTPTPGGGVLVTEIGGWVDRFDRRGQLLWSMTTPTSYPSDAQPLPNGDVLVAGFDTPGHIYVLTPRGRVVWSYGPSSGSGSLDRPSLAVPIGGGLIAATDDYGQRVVVIDRRTKRIVWQYGHLDQAGSAPGYLNKPDGLALIR
jgi:outer membrane protein assembly factor BamB